MFYTPPHYEAVSVIGRFRAAMRKCLGLAMVGLL